jgi:hypothetical protein
MIGEVCGVITNAEKDAGFECAELDAAAWIVVNGDGREVAGPCVLPVFAEHKATALGSNHSVMTILNTGRQSSTTPWWPI